MVSPAGAPRFTVSVVAALVLFMCLESHSAKAAEPGTLVYGLVPNAPPTTFLDAAGRPTGFFIELYSRIMDELGIAYEYRVAPFAELYPGLLSGKVDFFTTLVKDPEREANLVFPDQGLSVGWGQLFIASDSELRTVLDLQHRRVGVVRDDRNGLNFEAYMKSLAIPCSIAEFQDFERLVRAVQDGTVFAGVQSNWYVSAEKRIKPTAVVFAPFQSYPVLSRKSRHRADFDAIMSRYAELVRNPDSYFYELQSKWLGRERTETAVLPLPLLVGLGTLAAAVVVSIIFIRFLTKKLRRTNKELELRVEERTARLLDMERLAALGTLAANMAHELNSPLQAISAGVTILRSDCAETIFGPKDDGTKDDRGRIGRILAGRCPCSDNLRADALSARSAVVVALDGLGVPMDDALSELLAELGVLAPDRETVDMLARADGAFLRTLSSAARRMDALDLIENASGRMGSVVAALRTYAHRDLRKDASVVSLARQLDGVLDLVADRIRKVRVELLTDYGGLPDYRCYDDQLRQAWLSLLNNALDSMETIDGPRILRISGTKVWGGVRISISDTGPGVPEEYRARIFDPFFTTKQEGIASGLGLCVVQEIVRIHRGTIEFVSGDGGTTFIVQLPEAGISSDVEGAAQGEPFNG